MLLEHNIDVYNRLEEYLAKDNKAIVVIGTSGGKTTTALEYLYRHNCRGLAICPNKLILDSWSEYSEVDTISYQSFAKRYMSIDYSKYGVIICDEVHHAGADIWGVGIQYVLDKNFCKVIGLTATPVRSDGKDVADTLFGGNICKGIDVKDGIMKHIFHPFSYVGAYYDSESVRDEWKDKASEILLGKLDLAINNTPTVRDILRTNMPHGKRKGIVFVSDTEAVNDALSIMMDAFPYEDYRVIHSGMSDADVRVNKEWFKNTDHGYLVAINMISEGAHYNGVNTLIMLRRTCSRLVFEQQIGRIVTLTKYLDPHAIVFDLVNNAKTVKNFVKSMKEIKEEFGEAGIKAILSIRGVSAVSDQIIVKDYTSDIVSVIEEIKKDMDDKWEEWEDEIIRRYYATEGAAGCSKRIEEERNRRRS